LQKIISMNYFMTTVCCRLLCIQCLSCSCAYSISIRQHVCEWCSRRIQFCICMQRIRSSRQLHYQISTRLEIYLSPTLWNLRFFKLFLKIFR
jgi:hypothetical protein